MRLITYPDHKTTLNFHQLVSAFLDSLSSEVKLQGAEDQCKKKKKLLHDSLRPVRFTNDIFPNLQVSALQRLKCDKDMAVDVGPERPLHYLER